MTPLPHPGAPTARATHACLRRFLPVLAILLVARASPAQVADSAAAARAHWRAAAAALRAGDTVAALDALQRAATAWPSQPAYHLAVARIAAAGGRPDAALAALGRLTGLGVGWPDGDAAFAPLRNDPRWEPAVAAMHAATVPIVRGTVLARLRDTLFHPEGIVRDEPGRRWLVSSVRRRTILALGDDGRERPFPATASAPLDAMLGLAIDARRGLVWAATTALPQQDGWTTADSGRAALVAFELRSGRVMRRLPLPPGHQGADLAVDEDGAVFVSDPTGGLLVLAPRDTAVRVLSGSPLLRSPQGIAVLGRGRLLVADYSHGPLVVDVAMGSVAAVSVPEGVSLVGLDGLVALPDGRVAAMQNGLAPPRVLALRLDATGTRVLTVEVLDRQPALATEPTLGAVGRGRLVYVANSPWANYDDAGSPRPTARWPAPLLLGVPLR